MDDKFALSSLSRLLMGLLERVGIEDLVVSPGSRSTPYLSAALERRQLRVHVVVDERSAGYVALGLARARRQPVALLCTSGTAAANYLPAVVEARLTETPLAVLTADRPLCLQGCAAPQTIDQTRIFGTHVLASTALTLPGASEDEFIRARRQILSCLALLRGETSGPVHLNLHTPKPLELLAADTTERRTSLNFIDALIADTRKPSACASVRLSQEAIRAFVSIVSVESRGLITCGFEPDRAALDASMLARFARATGFPVLLDAAHPLRFDSPPELRPYLVAPFEQLLQIESWRLCQAPHLVVQIGRPLTSSAFERWLDPSQPEGRLKKHVLLARSGWPDPLGTAELVGSGDLSDALERAASALEADAPRSSGWAARWYRAGAVVQECVNQLGERRANGSGELGELDAVRTVLGAQPEGARLIIGNSLPIREVDLLAGPNLNRLEGVALRGASGIDGVVSMATGMALSDNRPNTLLLGDLSFLYDIGGLWATLPLSAPLAIVVLNNGGGRIFEQLPVANAVDAETLTHWTVPHRFDLGAAAKLYGLEHCRVDRISLLVAAIVEAHCRPGATVIEVVVAPDSARNQRSDLINRVRDALVQGGLLSEAPAA